MRRTSSLTAFDFSNINNKIVQQIDGNFFSEWESDCFVLIFINCRLLRTPLAMEELRMKWCQELEELLECPVCYDRLVGNIYFCEGGHNICSSCSRRVEICVLCTRPYTKTRNFLAEHISEKMDGIKASLADPYDPINAVLNFDKINIGVQTDFDPLFTSQSLSNGANRPPLPTQSITPWGVYPCWSAANCGFKGPYRRLLDHIKSIHATEFEEESPGGGFPFSRTWEIEFEVAFKCINRVFQISNIGLFILHVDTDENDNLRGHILKHDSGLIAKQCTYQMEIEVAGSPTFYIGEVDSTRTPKHALHQKGLFISSRDFSESSGPGKMSISIIIDRNINAPVPTRPKPRQKLPRNPRIFQNADKKGQETETVGAPLCESKSADTPRPTQFHRSNSTISSKEGSDSPKSRAPFQPKRTAPQPPQSPPPEPPVINNNQPGPSIDPSGSSERSKIGALGAVIIHETGLPVYGKIIDVDVFGRITIPFRGNFVKGKNILESKANKTDFVFGNHSKGPSNTPLRNSQPNGNGNSSTGTIRRTPVPKDEWDDDSDDEVWKRQLAQAKLESMRDQYNRRMINNPSGRRIDDKDSCTVS